MGNCFVHQAEKNCGFHCAEDLHEVLSQPALTCSKVKNRNTRTKCEIFSELTINHGNDVVLASLFLTFDKFHTFSWCFHCWIWVIKCRLGFHITASTITSYMGMTTFGSWKNKVENYEMIIALQHCCWTTALAYQMKRGF